MVVWLCFRGSVVVFLCFCGGVFFGVVVSLCWCGCGFVAVWLCLCGDVVVLVLRSLLVHPWHDFMAQIARR